MKQTVSVDTVGAEVLDLEKKIVATLDGHDFPIVMTTLNKVVANVLGMVGEMTGQPLADLSGQFERNLRFLLGLTAHGVLPDKEEMH